MYRRNHFGRHRGWFFWWFIPLFFLGPAHWWWGWGNAMFGIMLSIFLIALLAWGLSVLFAEQGPAAGRNWPLSGGMWQQPSQTPQAPPGPTGIYQAPYASEQEQRYHQGYRAQTGPRPGETASPQGATSTTGRTQPQYEEPQVEYPREEPPLVQ
ncbi:hypothetical protein [Thermogemmatispora sp.]|uniref:hypothetical protein n=1 Tax=Thermogemmatispora sp. TaxID=1968838 RepID=UPI001D70A3D9|nr:hypothetical protein [Thermogemmatispora sp.]MBX5450016.1 hypothetical protein [Thermogemmatispora sp.]